MTKEKRCNKHVWQIMTAVSIIFMMWTLFVISRGDEILPTAFKLAGSSQAIEDIEKDALGFMNMSMLKPLWEEIWIGILGLFCAFGLKQKKKYAWTLGIFWGVMLITNAVIQGAYEILILGWSNACLQTYVFLFLGMIALVSLFITRKEFLLSD